MLQTRELIPGSAEVGGGVADDDRSRPTPCLGPHIADGPRLFTPGLKPLNHCSCAVRNCALGAVPAWRMPRGVPQGRRTFFDPHRFLSFLN